MADTVKSRVRLLMLEDHRRDAELTEALLREAKLDFDVSVVDSRDAFVSALAGRPDLILADYSLPSFDGLKALELARELAPGVPFIFVSGGLGEEIAIDSLKNGATDYVLKHRIDRLVPAVTRALREIEDRGRRQTLTEQREELVERLRVQAERLEKLTQASVEIASSESLPEVVRLLANTTRELLRADDVFVTLSDADGSETVRATSSASTVPAEALLSRVTSFAETVVRPLILPTQDARSLIEGGASGRSCAIAVPLTTRRGAKAGAVVVLGQHAYLQEDLSVLVQIAQFASAAIENLQLYREAQAANRAKDDFLATLAHELRTPVTAILGWVQMLAEGNLDEATAASARQMIESSARIQAQIVDDVLDVSRIITGKLSLNRTAVELGPLVERTVATFRGPAESRGLKLIAKITREPVSIWGDATRLQQVLWNLLSNATKFTPEGGAIQVQLRRSDGHAEIVVTDTGEGITPDLLPHIFERYRQKDGSVTTRVHGGLGIGLAIVKYLVDVHGGAIAASSDGTGKGATFTLRFPLTVVVHETADGADRIDAVKILIVDDDPAARQTLAELLSERGAQVTVAESVGAAMQIARRFTPEVIISDIAMPGEDGYALIRQLDTLRLEIGRRLPAMALTSHGAAEDRVRILGSGFRHYVQKPVRAEELIRAIRSIAEERIA